MTRTTRADHPSRRITERDQQLLGFLSEHRLVLPAHVQAFLATSPAATARRLRALSAAGWVTREPVFHRQPPCCLITRRGLDLLGDRRPTPRVDLRGYRHDVGLAWLWLAAYGGTFGPLQEVISERRLRSRDAVAAHDVGAGLGHEIGAGTCEPLAVKLSGVLGSGARGRERLHYPDLVLVDRAGHRIAVELELTGKGRTRREGIMAAYAVDGRFDAVLYLVEHAGTARSVQAAARKVGISDRVHVQPVRLGAVTSSPAPDAALTRRRNIARERESEAAR